MRKLTLVLLLSLAVLFFVLPSSSSAQVAVGISVHIGPPALPVYAQPICPAPGYIWTPGFWAWGPDGYYWVPGTWVLAPRPGFLWTPGYWGWAGGAYVWHGGYWGPHVGFYGGINYGYGYGGVGFVGGAWHGGVFAYNTAVTHVNTTVIHDTYIDRTVVNNVSVNHVSYNGGEGGINARPTSSELAAEHEEHVQPTAEQSQHENMARQNPQLLASNNHGRPPIAATARPGEFSGHGVVAARPSNASFHPPANNGGRNNGEAHGNNFNSTHNNGSSAPHSESDFDRNHNSSNPHNASAPHNNSHPENKNNKKPPQHESHDHQNHDHQR